MIEDEKTLNADGSWNWQVDLLDERQRKELAFARLYAADFSHGTDGHNRLLLLARLADIIDGHPFFPKGVTSS